MDLAAGVAGGGAAGREQRRDLLVAPDLDEQHAQAGAGRRDRQGGGHGRLPGAPLAGHDHEPALEQRGRAQRCHGPSARRGAGGGAAGSQAERRRLRNVSTAESRRDPSTGRPRGRGGRAPLIVTCEQCATQFHLDDAKVPPGGVRVRCSRCKHAFFIEPAGRGARRSDPPIARRRTRWMPRRRRRPTRPRICRRRPAPPARTSTTRTTPPTRATGSSTRRPSAAISPERGPSPAAADARRRARGDRRSARLAPDAGRAERAPSPPAAAVAAPDLGAEEEDLGSPESWDLLARRFAAGRGSGRVDAARGRRSETRRDRGVAARPERFWRRPVAEWTPPSEPSVVLAWIARMGHAIGWSVTALLFSIVAIVTLAPTIAPEAEADFGRQRVAGLEAQGISGRWVENAVSGALFVVSGRLVNPTAAAGGAGDADRRAAARRERRPSAGRARRRGTGARWNGSCARRIRPASAARVRRRAVSRSPPSVIQPGQSLAFEAVVGDVPLAASRFVLEPLAPARSAPQATAGESVARAASSGPDPVQDPSACPRGPLPSSGSRRSRPCWRDRS